MGLWVDDLIHEYTHYKKELHKLKTEALSELDATYINSMIEEMEYAIQWMETGRNPNSYRGMDKKGVYQMNALAGVWDCIPDITEQIDTSRKHLFLTPREKESLSKIFATLSLRERECYIMHIGQRLTIEAIANELGVSRGTVQMYIKRAKAKINEINN